MNIAEATQSRSPYRCAAPAPDSIEHRELGPRFAAFRAHLTCPACARPVPLNGPELSARCSSCGDTLDIPPGLFALL